MDWPAGIIGRRRETPTRKAGIEGSRGGRPDWQPRQELADSGGNLRTVRLQREVAGVVEANLRIRHVAAERLGARRQEERIVLAPDREQRRAMGAQIFLEIGIERDVA